MQTTRDQMKGPVEGSVFFASKLIQQKMIDAARALSETAVVLDRLAEGWAIPGIWRSEF